jgi:transketolase
MIDHYLVPNLTTKKLTQEPMKIGYGKGLLAVGEKDEKIVALSTDEVGSTSTDLFAKAFPERFFEIGIAEQNLVTVASGLAAMGLKPFAASYGAFSPGRNWEQIKTTICINDRPVRVIATHVGLSDAPDGATHQMLEDIALMRVMPNMTVIVPCDSLEAARVVQAIADRDAPAYVRIARDNTPIITSAKTPFEIGKAYVYREGRDLTIIATGRMTYQALIAAEKLAKDGVEAEVLHVPTIKPLDNATILASVKKTGKVLTVEEAQRAGGLGGAVAELLGEEAPMPLKRMGVRDRYGESGNPEDLMELMGLTAKHIVLQAHGLVS